MKPMNFEEQNCTYAENQKEYMPLPAFRDSKGQAVSCWGLSLAERLRVLFTGKIWVSTLTFNNPLQPIALEVDKPLIKRMPYESEKTINRKKETV